MWLLHDRWVYEGVIDDPYGEFLINENKSLQKVCLFVMQHSIVYFFTVQGFLYFLLIAP
jgi:hypothetical protein